VDHLPHFELNGEIDPRPLYDGMVVRQLDSRSDGGCLALEGTMGIRAWRMPDQSPIEITLESNEMCELVAKFDSDNADGDTP